MAFSTDVRLPLDRPPVFPRRCVACGGSDPGASWVVSTRGLWQAAGNLAIFFKRLVRAAVRIEVPACGECCRALRTERNRRRTLRWLGALGLGAGLVLAGRWQGLDEHGWLGTHYLEIGALLLAVIFLLPLEYFRPLAFDVALGADSIEFEFRDRNFAEEFARLNDVEIEE
jgi:hypothetical protein